MESIDIVWSAAFLLLTLIINVIHVYLRCYIRDKPMGMKSLHDSVFKDTIILTQMCSSTFCLVAVLSRFESVRYMFGQIPLLLTAVCVVYVFAFISVGVNNGCICIVRILCIFNMTFMEEDLGERLVRILTVGSTMVASGIACIIFFVNDDINSGTPMSLLTNSSVPTGEQALLRWNPYLSTKLGWSSDICKVCATT